MHVCMCVYVCMNVLQSSSLNRIDHFHRSAWESGDCGADRCREIFLIIGAVASGGAGRRTHRNRWQEYRWFRLGFMYVCMYWWACKVSWYITNVYQVYVCHVHMHKLSILSISYQVYVCMYRLTLSAFCHGRDSTGPRFVLRNYSIEPGPLQPVQVSEEADCYHSDKR